MIKNQQIIDSNQSLDSSGNCRNLHNVPRGLLKYLILSMLEKEDLSGIQIIDKIKLLTDGRWNPGAGSIYPALHKFLASGLITVNHRNKQKKYKITDRGLKQLTDGRIMISSYTKHNSYIQILGLILDDKFFLTFVNNIVLSLLAGIQNYCVNSKVDNKLTSKEKKILNITLHKMIDELNLKER